MARKKRETTSVSTLVAKSQALLIEVVTLTKGKNPAMLQEVADLQTEVEQFVGQYNNLRRKIATIRMKAINSSKPEAVKQA